MKITLWAKQVYENSKERWITWRTGKDKIQREWEAWCDVTVHRRANTVEDYYCNFKHIIEVDPAKVYDPACPFGWTYVKDFQQFAFPNRALGENTMCEWFRCLDKSWDGKTHINEIGGGDHLFAATNNDKDAIIITLKYV